MSDIMRKAIKVDCSFEVFFGDHKKWKGKELEVKESPYVLNMDGSKTNSRDGAEVYGSRYRLLSIVLGSSTPIFQAKVITIDLYAR